MKRIIVYVVTLLLTVAGFNSPTHAQPAGIRIFTENDFLSPFAKNEDDNYTGGLRVEAVFQQPALLRFPFLLKNKLPRETLYQTLAFTGTTFTPRNLAATGIVKEDRPYASVVGLSIGAQFKSTKNKKVHFGYELLAGQMGKPFMGELQGKIHRRETLSFIETNRPDPKGWPNQIANGGAFVVNLELNHERLLFQSKESERYFVPVRISIKNSVNAGNYLINSAHGFRFNFFNKQYDFDNEIAPPVITQKMNEAIVKVKPIKKPRVFSFSVYMEPRLKINVHNAALTGKLLSRKSVHTIYTTNYAGGLTPMLFEYEAGVVARFYFLQAGFSLNGRSKEFAAQNKSMHHWGGFFVGVVVYR